MPPKIPEHILAEVESAIGVRLLQGTALYADLELPIDFVEYARHAVPMWRVLYPAYTKACLIFGALVYSRDQDLWWWAGSASLYLVNNEYITLDAFNPHGKYSIILGRGVPDHE